jgi:hypothetical protein
MRTGLQPPGARGVGVAKKKAKAPRPRRTRGHVIASQSLNYVEKFFIDQGHTADRPAQDYGYDLLVNTFDRDGYAENGEILIQLKASDGFSYSADKTFISYAVSIKHYELWAWAPLPVFLVLYDARLTKAYWLYVQEYFESDPSRRPKANAKTLTVRVPVVNKFTAATVEYMRARKAAVLAQIEGRVGHRG